MYSIYVHKKKGTDEIFNVGRAKTNKRPYSKGFRNKWWHNIVNKYGFDVEIWAYNLTLKEANIYETYLIKKIGRKDLGLGSLINLTNGGDGKYGCIVSEETKKRMSEAHKNQIPWMKGKHHSKKTKNLQSIANRGNLPWNTGKHLSEKTKDKISNALKGKQPWNTGKHLSEKTRDKISKSMKELLK